MKKVMSFIWGVLDFVKDFLFNWGLKILLVLFFGMVLHNILKIGEISTGISGEYKHLHLADAEERKMLNVYQVGEGSKTIVILPGFGSQSPVIQYKTLAEGLKDEYRVVIIEYFGYGFSMGIKKDRTSENIAKEVMAALDDAGIAGPYVLMPHSLSNVYAMKMQQLYPDRVQAIVSIDGTYPVEISDNYYYEQQQATKTNVNITSILELTGFERVLSYVKPEVFYIDRMQSMKDVYTEDDIKLYRNRIAGSYLTRTMVREINQLLPNLEDLRDYIYPDYLPVLSILSQDTVNKYNENKSTNGTKYDLNEIVEKTISNPNLQKTIVIDGDHSLQLTNPTEVIRNTKSFLGSF